MAAQPEWSVMLGGQYEPYDAPTASAIEEAFQRGDEEVQATIDGKLYVIVLKPPMKQQLSSDPTRQRAIQRRPAPADEAATTVCVAYGV